MPLRPPKQIWQNQRELDRWCREQSIVADDDSVDTASIQDEAVTLAKIQDITADRLLGRVSTAGVTQQLTAAQVADLLEGTGWNFTATVSFAGATTFSGNVGFFGGSAVAQQTSPSSPSFTIVSGTGDDVTINSNFSSLKTAVDALKLALDNLSLTG